MSDRTCLVVDDQAAIRTYLRVVLKKENLQTLEAGTAAQALKIIQQLDGRLDLIITDINMPGDMDGLDLRAGETVHVKPRQVRYFVPDYSI